MQSDQHFFAHCLDSRIPPHDKTRISMLQLVSVAEETGLKINWAEVQKAHFSYGVAHIKRI